MPDPLWLLPAKSIPVWVGARLYSAHPDILIALADDQVFDESIEDQPFRIRHPGEVVDLSNPDTFAAARDRLAVALGWSADDVGCGVAFFRRGGDGGSWTLVSPYLGGADVTFDIDATSRELALALAWQRVVGS